MAKRWYVVHAYSGFENKVADALKQRVERLGMQEKFGEILVPTEEVVEMRGGQKRKSQRKFFPGYVLVEMELDEDSWHLVKETPRVMGFIGGKADKPSPITEAEARAILRRVEEGAEKPRPKTIFEPGEMVRVVDGPFNDFNGVVEQVDYDKNRLKVAVLIFGRSTPVALFFAQVEMACGDDVARRHRWRRAGSRRRTACGGRSEASITHFGAHRWPRRSILTSSCRSRPARPTRVPRWDRRWARRA